LKVAAYDALPRELAEAPGLPGLVVLELMGGCRNKREMAAVRALVQGFVVYWPTRADGDRATATYARLRLRFHISIPDLLIGECAVGLPATLCTFNVKAFGPAGQGVVAGACEVGAGEVGAPQVGPRRSAFPSFAPRKFAVRKSPRHAVLHRIIAIYLLKIAPARPGLKPVGQRVCAS
jgi:predicted nucleic acid-binding protein